jgi:hypothetical protein
MASSSDAPPSEPDPIKKLGRVSLNQGRTGQALDAAPAVAIATAGPKARHALPDRERAARSWA